MPKRSSIIKYLWLLLWVAVFLLSPLVDGLRLWGFDHLRYHPLYFTIVSAIMIAVFLIPAISIRIHEYVINLHKCFRTLTGMNRWLVSIAVVIIFSLSFYYFRSAVQFLGDGYLRGDELGRGLAHLSLKTEPLDSLLHFYFYKLTNSIFGFGTHKSFMVFSSLVGGFFVLAVLSLFKPGRKSGISPFILLMSLGGLLFYFGYEESYSLVYLGILIFFGLVYRYESECMGFKAMMIIYAITVLCHFSALYLLPAVLWLIFKNQRAGKLSVSDRLTAFISLATVAITVLFFRFIYSSQFLSEHQNFLIGFGFFDYKLFSLKHLADIINQILLSGLPFVLLLPFIFSSLKNLSKFYWITIAGAMLYLVLVDPKLGMARDWDLFASVGLVLILSLYQFVKKIAIDNSGLRRIVSSAILIALVINLNFIAVNHNFKKNVNRYENILELYGERSAYGYENLGAFFRRNYHGPDDLKTALKYYHKALSRSDNPRYLTSIAGTYNIFYKWAADSKGKQFFLDSIKYYADRAIQFNDSLSLPYDYLSLAEYYHQNIDSALIYSDSALKYAIGLEKADIHHHRGIILIAENSLDSARYQFQQAINLKPDFSEPYAFLGRTYLGMKMIDSARYYFKQFIKYSDDRQAKQQIEEILEKLR